MYLPEEGDKHVIVGFLQWPTFMVSRFHSKSNPQINKSTYFIFPFQSNGNHFLDPYANPKCRSTLDSNGVKSQRENFQSIDPSKSNRREANNNTLDNEYTQYRIGDKIFKLKKKQIQIPIKRTWNARTQLQRLNGRKNRVERRERGGRVKRKGRASKEASKRGERRNHDIDRHAIQKNRS